MKRKPLEHLPCSLARALDQAGDWWTLLIVRDLLRGLNGFDAIQNSLGIASNILAKRLAELVGNGLIEKVQDHADRRRSRYILTQKGHELAPSLVALMQWGDRWISGSGNEPMILTNGKTGKRIDTILLQSAGVSVASEDIVFMPGPGLHSAIDASKKKGTSN
jgi:DNA-binding HxlR family transcriptional regulator